MELTSLSYFLLSLNVLFINSIYYLFCFFLLVSQTVLLEFLTYYKWRWIALLEVNFLQAGCYCSINNIIVVKDT